jgi:hypothetical protein
MGISKRLREIADVRVHCVQTILAASGETDLRRLLFESHERGDRGRPMSKANLS